MRPFGELEAAIMRDLWERTEPATVRDVLASLSTSRKLAYTTVITALMVRACQVKIATRGACRVQGADASRGPTRRIAAATQSRLRLAIMVRRLQPADRAGARSPLPT